MVGWGAIWTETAVLGGTRGGGEAVVFGGGGCGFRGNGVLFLVGRVFVSCFGFDIPRKHTPTYHIQLIKN